MYTVYSRDDIKNCKSITVCKDIKSRIKTVFFVIVFLIINIIIHGMYPEPVIALLKEIGIIEYTIIENAHIKKCGKSDASNCLQGTYTSTDGNKYKASIMFVPFSFHNFNLNNSGLINSNDNTTEAAYYTFRPNYEILRHHSLVNIILMYAFLGCLIYLLFSSINKKHYNLRNADFMTLIRPVGIFSTESYDERKIKCYRIRIVWETPNGECCGELESTTSKTEPKSFDFPHEYCACYIKTADNKEMIVTEKNYFEIEKYPKLRRKLQKLKMEFTHKEKEQGQGQVKEQE